MKKNLLSVLFICYAGANLLNAQIKVHSDGTVDIGNKAIQYLRVSSDGTIYFERGSTWASKIHPNGTVRIGNPRVPPFSSNTLFDFNGYEAVFRYGGFPQDVGFIFNPWSVITSNNNYEQIMTFSGLSHRGAGIGFSNNQLRWIYSDSYYTSGSHLGIISASDARLKTNVRNLSSTTERIAKLRPVTYNFAKSGSGEDVSKNIAYQNRTGFLAQEVKEIFPDLVVEISEGGKTKEEAMKSEKIYGLDYAGLIPYLVKAIQEQNETIEKLQQQVNDIQKGVYANFAIDAISNGANQPKAQAVTDVVKDNMLYQNAPNPFNNSTTITYQLADNATHARICIYNLTGKQLQCYELPAITGQNAIEVRAASLQSGMYLYSLIVGNTLVDTKRMVLTE